MPRTAPILLLLGPLLACAAQQPDPTATLSTREGSSCQRPVVIDADRESAGAAAQREWLEKHYPGSRIERRLIITCAGKPAELIEIDTVNQRTVRVYFDISKYYGKF